MNVGQALPNDAANIVAYCRTLYAETHFMLFEPDAFTLTAEQQTPRIEAMARSDSGVLFVCDGADGGYGLIRAVFADWPGIEVSSAGLNHDVENSLTRELLEWTQLIFVMERAHKSKLSMKFRAALKGQRVVCLDIPDEYDFMDPALVELLKARVPRHLSRQ